MTRRPRTRRDLLGGGASLLLLTAAAAGQAKAEELDGELIAAATEYARLEDQYCVLCLGEDELPEPERSVCATQLAAISARQRELFDAMFDMPARTPEGLRAKALAALCKVGDGDSNATQPISYDDNLTWSLLCDILGRAA